LKEHLLRSFSCGLQSNNMVSYMESISDSRTMTGGGGGGDDDDG